MALPPCGIAQSSLSVGRVLDSHGEPIVQFDPEAERRLRNKLDRMIVPTVSILYLFCFIDRANIGTSLYLLLSRLDGEGEEY